MSEVPLYTLAPPHRAYPRAQGSELTPPTPPHPTHPLPPPAFAHNALQMKGVPPSAAPTGVSRHIESVPLHLETCTLVGGKKHRPLGHVLSGAVEQNRCSVLNQWGLVEDTPNHCKSTLR